MDGGRDPGRTELMHERLLALERRVGDLERMEERRQRTRSRGRLYLLVFVALYLVLVWWEMKKLG